MNGGRKVTRNTEVRVGSDYTQLYENKYSLMKKTTSTQLLIKESVLLDTHKCTRAHADTGGWWKLNQQSTIQHQASDERNPPTFKAESRESDTSEEN